MSSKQHHELSSHESAFITGVRNNYDKNFRSSNFNNENPGYINPKSYISTSQFGALG
jgi:hypothetical protein